MSFYHGELISPETIPIYIMDPSLLVSTLCNPHLVALRGSTPPQQ